MYGRYFIEMNLKGELVYKVESKLERYLILKSESNRRKETSQDESIPRRDVLSNVLSEWASSTGIYLIMGILS